jgi:hypothetical protein
MRRHALPLAAVALVAAAAACTPNAFEVTLTGQTTIQGDPLGVGSVLTRIPAIGSFASIDFASTDEFQSHGVPKDAVQSLKVTSLKLQVLSPDTQSFDFLDDITFYASAGMGETAVAGKTGIAQLNLPAPNPVLFLEVDSDAELLPYLTAPSISLTARGSGREPPQDTVIEATVKLRVAIKLL